MISMAYVAIFDVSIQGVYFGQMGIGRVASGDFSTSIRGSRISVQALGLGARGHRFRPDPGGRSERSSHTGAGRPLLAPTPERCIEALPPPADAVRGDRGAQAPSSPTDRRWQRRDYGARSAGEDAAGYSRRVLRVFFEATSAHISKIKQVLVPWTSSRPSRSVTLGLIGPVWGVIGRRKDILNSRVVDPMPRLRVEWIARPILDRASLPQAHHERSQQGLGGLFRVRCRIGLDLISAIAAAE